VNSRLTAISFAVLAIALTIVQDIWPARDWYHGWEYITILAIAIVVLLVNVSKMMRGPVSEKRFALALAGAVAVAVAGLLSGLIGPDTVTVVGTPGTVTPVMDLNAAAFFPAADAQTLVHGDATVILRRRGADAVVIGPHPQPLGLSVAFTQLQPAAYIVVRDANGNRLTVTQPNNPAFLSPVMLFRQKQEIHGQTLPLDTFAVPGAQRTIHILYFSAAALAAIQQSGATQQPGAILSVSDASGTPQGRIAMVTSGNSTTIGGITITVTLGTYPVLQVASAPQPLVVLGGIIVFAAGLVWSMLRDRAVATPHVIPSEVEGQPQSSSLSGGPSTSSG
jgi:hypothetical protein